jgi:hypothetical protein
MTMAPIENLPEWLATSIRVEAARRGTTPTAVLAEAAVVFDQWLWEVDDNGNIVGGRPATPEPIDEPVTEEFLAHAAKTIKRFKPVLDKLATT